MKKILLFLLMFISCVCLTSCKEKNVIYLTMPSNTNIQYWITEDFTGKDLKGHQILLQEEDKIVFYGIEYMGYVQDGIEIFPDIYVKYTISPYRNSKADEKVVTNIYITDRTVDIYGINLNSTFSEFDKALEDAGFEIIKKNNKRHIAEYENITIYFCNDYIEITANIYE